MATNAKIATCSYCSTRVVISLSSGVRHDLICSTCGAPLTETKLIQSTPAPTTILSLFKQPEKTEERPEEERKEKRKSRDSEDYYKRKKYEKYRDRDDDDDDDDDDEDDDRKNYRRKKSKRKRRGLLYWFREAADEIEDIFD